eukprot:comp22311_c0_seq1/m.33137 comp22311_c0_seq1/g.33137  ORF comp22311_c0_seq1/g.33137 comp22311_c0_seq1/m.33137 type:complete len:588 (-) comp22311_c0_seq1:790-2553(-)
MSLPNRNTGRPTFIELLGKELVDSIWDFNIQTYFSDIEILGHENVPAYGPCIVVANHNNQFVDAMIVQACVAECGREAQFIIAAKSYNRPVIGHFAKMMKSIPVARAIDNTKNGTGTITIAKDSTKVEGQATLFTNDLAPGDNIKIGKDFYRIQAVVSDTELTLSSPCTESVSELAGWKFSKKVSQDAVYGRVHDLFLRGGCLGIFPEGGSHDNTQMLPLKPGVAIMALGAMAKYPKLNVPIIPIGINYYGGGHRFRSKVVVQFGPPIEIDKSLVEQYASKDRKEVFAATAKVMEQVKEGMDNMIVTTQSYNDLILVHMMRRLYLPVRRRINREEYHLVNKNLSKAMNKVGDRADIAELKQELLQYREDLKTEGISDRQVIRMIQQAGHRKRDTVQELLSRSVQVIFMGTFVLPGILLAQPGVIFVNNFAQKKMVEAVKGSDVKQKGLDVVASWKVLTMLFVIPAMLFTYSAIFGALLYHYTGWALTTVLLWSLVFALVFFAYEMQCIRAFDDLVRVFWSIRPLYLRATQAKKGLFWVERRIELQKKVRDFIERLGREVFGAEEFEKIRVIKHEELVQADDEEVIDW